MAPSQAHARTMCQTNTIQSTPKMQDQKKDQSSNCAAASCFLLGMATFYALYAWSDSATLELALPHQRDATRFVLVTALYDIHQTEHSYMAWFQRTIRKFSGAATMHTIVFCKERRVADAAWQAKRNGGLVTVLEEKYPLSNLAETVQPAIGWAFSKFRWMQRATQMFVEEEKFFWVDADISRFLLLGQTTMGFPLLLKRGKISVQTVFPSQEALQNASSAMFQAGIFGGHREDVLWLSEQMLLLLLEIDFIARNVSDCMALLHSRFPERFNILFASDFVGESMGCNSICI